ncbi:hypothetical protein DFJ77DRAFT_287462 [Powellomyces hirtus]|nr:hypothetical protein DFJ77DRAFT_287462 [Powellomyces hirtus]
MGIKGLSKWLQASWPSAFTTKNARQTVDCVYVDINPLLHRAARTCRNENQCIKRLYMSLDDLVLRGTNPRRLVCLAVDGPGPLAKIAEQRRRRSSNKKKKSTFDTRQITPGTAFMNRIDSYLNYYACQYLFRTAHSKPGMRVIVNGPNVAGEGEVKILGHMGDTMTDNKSPEGTPSNMIIGADNDILFQVIAANVRSTLVMNDDNAIMFSYDTFLRTLSADFPDRKAHLVALDLAAVILLMGNDYLPKMKKASFDGLWANYKKTADARPGEYLVDLSNESINPHFMKAIVSMSEPSQGQRGAWRPETTHSTHKEDDSNAEDEADAEPGDRDRWEAENTPSTRRDKCQKFLQGIIWCLEMCVNGNCPDYSFNYPYYMAPARDDLIEYLDQVIRDRSKDQALAWPRSSIQAVHPVVCAAMLLGTEGKSFMDVSWHTLMETSLPPNQKLLESQTFLDQNFRELMKLPSAACNAHMSEPAYGLPVEFRNISSPSGFRFHPILPPFANTPFNRPFERSILDASGHLRKRRHWHEMFLDIELPIEESEVASKRRRLSVVSPPPPRSAARGGPAPHSTHSVIGSSMSATAQVSKVSTTQCRFALKGACRKGDACTFSHNVSNPQKSNDNKITVREKVNTSIKTDQSIDSGSHRTIVRYSHHHGQETRNIGRNEPTARTERSYTNYQTPHPDVNHRNQDLVSEKMKHSNQTNNSMDLGSQPIPYRHSYHYREEIPNSHLNEPITKTQYINTNNVRPHSPPSRRTQLKVDADWDGGHGAFGRSSRNLSRGYSNQSGVGMDWDGGHGQFNGNMPVRPSAPSNQNETHSRPSPGPTHNYNYSWRKG